MRSFIYVAPFVAAAYAQSSSAESSASSSSSSIPYSNPNTAYLTETNSYGVVTGMPSNTAVAATSQPVAVTAQPTAAQIPANLPAGLHTIFIGNASSFTIDVGSSTTSILGGGVVADATTGSGNSASPSESAASGSSSGSHSSGSSSGTQTTGTGSTSHASTTTSASATANTTNAAVNVKAAAGSFLGLGALFVALL